MVFTLIDEIPNQVKLLTMKLIAKKLLLVNEGGFLWSELLRAVQTTNKSLAVQYDWNIYIK